MELRLLHTWTPIVQMGRVRPKEGRLLVHDVKNQLYWANLGTSQRGERGSLSRTAMDGGQ